ncbi:MAG: TonB-dependent receptor [Bacteroidales bacterium]|nr:TonB-dependent receptor [Bacteroidales bacterium]
MNKRARVKSVLSFLSMTILGFFLASSAMAQYGSVRGFVYEKDNGEPVIFCSVYLDGTTYGTATDVNGFFNITRVKPGSYTLKVTSVGFGETTKKIVITDGGIIDEKLYLKSKIENIDEVVVSGERQEMRTQVHTSIIKVTPKQMAKIPTIGSEPDLAQYLQILPGVIFTGDQGGQLYIRGGAPIQNKVLLDGMIIYNPFHSIGLFSVFDSDVIRNADIYTGGFGAQYGGRISSIMDITTRDGNKNRISSKISSSTFMSKVLVEGPIKKARNENEGSSSFILSAKHSYLEQSSRYLYSYVDTAGLPFNFTDFYGKVSINAKNGTKVNFFGFNYSDNVTYRGITDIGWTSSGAGTNVVLVPSNYPALIKANVAYSTYLINMAEADQQPRQSSINGFNVGLSFIYFFGKDELDYGIETLGFNTNFNYFNSVGRKITQTQFTTELAAYAKYKLTWGKLLFEPSFRLHYYASLAEASPEPRVGIKYNLSETFRLKFSGGMYSQNLIAANSDRDVVNLFYGFLSGPENLQKEFDGKKITSKLQKSNHAIFGFEFDLTNRVNLNVEGYLKDNVQLTNINRNKLYDDTGENQDKPEYLRKDFIIETGQAYGLDFLLKYDYKRLYIWAVYSLGYVTRYDGITSYPPHFDRRHNVNLVGAYTFGADLDWEVGTRWNLGSGFPFTQTQGFYEKIPFHDGINTDYTTANGELGIVYGPLNQGRLPYYHRLDLNLKKTFNIGQTSKIEATLSITNVYNRKNIFYFDRVRYERVNQLPFMPTIGLKWSI